jgi:hypothetical protein
MQTIKSRIEKTIPKTEIATRTEKRKDNEKLIGIFWIVTGKSWRCLMHLC